MLLLLRAWQQTREPRFCAGMTADGNAPD